MQKKKPKRVQGEQKTAGNSRLVVDNDAYKPFANLGAEAVKKIEKPKESPVAQKPVSVRKEPRVLGYDPKANFGDILSAWEQTGELGGVTKRMKSHSEVKVQKTFEQILQEWDAEKVAQKQEKKPQPIKKSAQYQPKKDFAALLDEFEGVPKPAKMRQAPPEKQVQTESLKPSETIQEALVEKDELDEERKSDVSWSFAATYRQWTAQTDETKALKSSQKERKDQGVEIQSIAALRALEPQATLDLHGYKVLEAEKACADFLRECKDKHLAKVAIITGKGLHNTKGYSLLKEAALSQIRISGLVREAYTPKAMHGGSGAIWIILKEK